MSINYGTNNISDVYYGSVPITAVYYGAQKIWGKSVTVHIVQTPNQLITVTYNGTAYTQDFVALKGQKYTASIAANTTSTVLSGVTTAVGTLSSTSGTIGAGDVTISATPFMIVENAYVSPSSSTKTYKIPQGVTRIVIDKFSDYDYPVDAYVQYGQYINYYLTSSTTNVIMQLYNADGTLVKQLMDKAARSQITIKCYFVPILVTVASTPHCSLTLDGYLWLSVSSVSYKTDTTTLAQPYTAYRFSSIKMDRGYCCGGTIPDSTSTAANGSTYHYLEDKDVTFVPQVTASEEIIIDMTHPYTVPNGATAVNIWYSSTGATIKSVTPGDIIKAIVVYQYSVWYAMLREYKPDGTTVVGDLKYSTYDTQAYANAVSTYYITHN